jgi:signal transduction histidine kinase/FixJ family two-component response regulator
MLSNTKQPARSDEILPISCTILIVDDSATDRYTYRRYLETTDRFEAQIWGCDSAITALDLCEQTCPNLILLDYLMPELDGLQFLQELAERVDVVPPTIMLTGQGNEIVAVEAMKHGAIDYLIKSQLTPLKLTSAIVNALSMQKLQAQIDRQHQQQQLLARIVVKIGQSVELSEVLQSAVQGCRELLDCDRVAVYKLQPDLSGTIVAEAVLPQWTSSLGKQIEEGCFDDRTAHPISKYLAGRSFIVSDIDTAELLPCYVTMLKEFQVRSLAIVPILFREISPRASDPIVWGLLIVHQCRSSRTWVANEINLVNELSIQMAVAIQQAELVSDLQASLAQQQAVEQQLRDRVLEIEQTNLRLSVATNLLEKRNQELNEFACIASHDLQAPLRRISNLTNWLSQDLEGTLPEENQQQIDLVQIQILQMNALIKGLLHYARVGRDNIELTNINLSDMFTEVLLTIEHSPEFEINFPTDLPDFNTHSLHLKQVFANLISNAIKYHDRPNGKIDILATEREHSWQFTVIDDGPGIAPEHHQKIFGIFQTLAGQADNKGTGVGLAIVKKIVESRGGSIWVDSDLGKGSAFSFTWIANP